MENPTQRTESTSQPYEGDVSINNTHESKPATSGDGDELDINKEYEEDDDDDDDDDENEVEHEITKPYVGMLFDSVDDAFQFYNKYALEMGFSIRKGSTRKSKRNDALIWRELLCSKEGFRREIYKRNEMRKKKHRGESRIGCQAKLVVKLRGGQNGAWVVSIFEEEHNHKFEAPKKRRLLPLKRKIRESQGDLIYKMSDAGLKEVGGSKDVDCDEMDDLRTKRKMEIRKGDTQAVLEYFNDMQVENPNFFYSIQLDLDGHLTSFFWSDARSRMDYTSFGDVVCFDATYGRNKYNMPFVPIVGINNHLQTTFFGGALILDQTEASYVWVLETWMKAMKGLHPKIIFTDQDSAMSDAITRVFPDTCHRYCLWHIFQNAQKHLSHLYLQNPSFAKDFSNCIYNNETIEEFESTWDSLLTKYNLHGNEWMKSLYSKRQQWVPVYSHSVFSADMSTTQRSESINKFFKDFLKRGMLLPDFVRAVDRALVSRREKELRADFQDNQVVPPLKLGMQIEEDAGKNYTISVFRKFQEELVSSLRYICEKVEDDGNTFTYKCSHENKDRIIKLSSFDSSAKCSCRKFEYAGILCRHILKVFIVTNVVKVPKQYILKRWTRDAKCGLIVNEEGEQIQPLSLRYSSLCHQGTYIAAKGASSVEVYKVAMHGLQRTLKEVEIALKRVLVESVGSHKKDDLAKEKSRKNKSTSKKSESGSAQCRNESGAEELGSLRKKCKNDKMPMTIVNEESGGVQCQEDKGAEADANSKQPTLSNVAMSQSPVLATIWPSPGLLPANQHHHRLSQSSIVTGLQQPLVAIAPRKPQHDSLVQNTYYLQQHQFNQGTTTTSASVLDTQQPHGNISVDLTKASQVYFWQPQRQ